MTTTRALTAAWLLRFLCVCLQLATSKVPKLTFYYFDRIYTYIHTYIYIYIYSFLFYLFFKIIFVQRICLFYHIIFSKSFFSLISISCLTRCGVSVLFPSCCSPLCSPMLGIAHLLYLPHCVSLLPSPAQRRLALSTPNVNYWVPT